MPDQDRPTDEQLRAVASNAMQGSHEVIEAIAAECIRLREENAKLDADGEVAILNTALELTYKDFVALRKQLAAANALRKAAEGEHSLSIECAAYDAERAKVKEPTDA